MPKKILIIDDEPELVKAIQVRLETAGYKVISAFDGEEGINQAEKEKPDLIILDVIMPKMDGFTTLKELEKKFHRNTLPPVIVLTGKDKMEDLFAIEGITDYIVKPFEGKALLDKIAKVLD
ncbi:MAG: response regulator [Candidatus Omnitrophota bacterium]